MKISTTRLVIALTTMLAALAVTGSPAIADPADLDASYGTAGVRLIDEDVSDFVNDTVLQPDGKLVVVGTSGDLARNGLAVRLRADGTTDPTFGVRRLTVPGAGSLAKAVALQPDGRIVVVGSDSSAYGIVWRLLADGSTDKSFGGGDGLVRIGGKVAESFSSVAIAADGDIVVGGFADTAGATVYRFTRHGDYDTSWGGTGGIALGGTSYGVKAVAVRPDGRVLVTGGLGSTEGAAVRSLTPTGGTDASFGGGDGIAGVPGADTTGEDLVLQADGRVLVAGRERTNAPGNSADGVVVRYSSAGVVDSSFGGPSGARIDAGGYEGLTRLALTPSGGVLASGYDGEPNVPLVARLRADGRPDTSFGGDGITLLTGDVEEAYGLALQADGRILVAADIVSSAPDIAVYRLLGDYRPKPAARCGGKPATIVGTKGKDRIRGTRKADVIVALGGNDKVLARGGKDVVCGGPGKDVLNGGAGRDRLIGGPGRDTIRQGGV